MKRFLLVAAMALAAFSSTCAAQSPQPDQPDHTMDTLLTARAALIQRYVQSLKIARGVAVCGDTDMLTGEEHSYLCIYVYRDSVKSFLPDFINFAKEISPGGELGVNGVPVSVELIGPVSKIENEPNARPNPKARPLPSTSKT
jgi:opacity protein-like surface antigen